MLIFRERLNRAQLVALLIALAAVILLSVEVGDVPVIALGLAGSFGLYGAVKKVVAVDPPVSVGLEAAIAAPLAIGYLVALQLGGHGQFTNHGPGHLVLMILAGPVTAIPPCSSPPPPTGCRWSPLGLLMYLNPAMQMTWGVVVGHEPMPPGRWIGFAPDLGALVVFTVDAVRRARADQPAAPMADTARRNRRILIAITAALAIAAIVVPLLSALLAPPPPRTGSPRRSGPPAPRRCSPSSPWVSARCAPPS